MRLSLCLLGLFLCVICSFASCQSLPVFNVPIHNTSVSGLSSGGYFAVQMHIAYSSILCGAGIFAGGPYNCAKGDLTTALSSCMKGTPKPDVQSLISTTDSRSASGEIDDTSNLQNQKVFMFSGTEDTTVYQTVMNSLQTYYQNYINTNNIYYENSLDAAHTQPTIDTNTNPCTKSYSPYISYCNYDGAGEALKQIYGDLNPPNTGTPMGQIYSFDQSDFLSNPTSKSVAKTGYYYAPDSCMQNHTCTLHVAFHGCLQSYQSVGNAYITEAGYNAWADTNNFIILYPQVQKSSVNPSNPNGCWDWWGYNNPNTYDIKSGDQMNMVYLMIQHISSGYYAIASPTSLHVNNVSDSSVSLSWARVETATGYQVLRNGHQISSQPITGTSFVDNTVLPGTYYYYQVIALASGSQSAPSTPVGVKTNGSAPIVSPPNGLNIQSSTASSITLSWTAVQGAIGYNVYRNSTQANTKIVVGTSFTDNSLSVSTYYSYYVVALNSDLIPSQPSNSVIGETTSGFVCQSYTDSNYDQVAAGRAYQTLGKTYAVGSNDYMGLYNVFEVSTLSETSPGYYIVGNCP